MIPKSRELSQAGNRRELKEKTESSKKDSLHDCCSEIQGSGFNDKKKMDLEGLSAVLSYYLAGG